MQVHIGGHGVEIGQTLQEHTEDRLAVLTKYFDNIIDVDVSFRTERHHHYGEVTAVVSGMTLRAVGDGADFYIAIDDATHKLEKQLRRYKKRLQKLQKRRETIQEKLADASGWQATHSLVEEESLEDAPTDMLAEFAPKIVHKNVKDIPTLTVDEAVMQMDLLHTNVYIFVNVRTNELNVVSRPHEDGEVMWIEPAKTALAQKKAS